MLGAYVIHADSSSIIQVDMLEVLYFHSIALKDLCKLSQRNKVWLSPADLGVLVIELEHFQQVIEGPLLYLNRVFLGILIFENLSE